VAPLTEGPNGHQRDVFVYEDIHIALAQASIGVTCSSASEAA
jgi:hypothetical protein